MDIKRRKIFFIKFAQDTAVQKETDSVSFSTQPFEIPDITTVTSVWGSNNIPAIKTIINLINETIGKLSKGQKSLGDFYKRKTTSVADVSDPVLKDLMKISMPILSKLITNNFTTLKISDIESKKEIINSIISEINSTSFSGANVGFPDFKNILLNNLNIIKNNL